jgi:hypothetical protein
MESDLDSLIQKLSSSSSSSSSTDGTASSDSSTSELEGSFQNLLTALGASSGNSDSNSTLTKFLQALETRMQGMSPAGNVVNTTA